MQDFVHQQYEGLGRGAQVLEFRVWGSILRDPKKHISISILLGYPYHIGLHDMGIYMGYPYPNFCLCAFLGAVKGLLCFKMFPP